MHKRVARRIKIWTVRHHKPQPLASARADDIKPKGVINMVEKIEIVAGAPGFEPGHAGTKNQCLTAWLRPTMKQQQQIACAFHMRGH
jgi:hypothetical protein